MPRAVTFAFQPSTNRRLVEIDFVDSASINRLLFASFSHRKRKSGPPISKHRPPSINFIA